MIAREFLRVRNDGVKLFMWIDAKVDENNQFIRDEKNNLIPTGYMIQQVQTGSKYDVAVDIENAPYTYVETDELIPPMEEII